LAAFATDLMNHYRGLEDYTSNALKLFMDHLDKQPQSKLLDIGPVCQENIRFFAERVWKHYVCDMFIRLDRHIRMGEPVDQIWKALDYHPENFDGILVWELADRLDEQDVKRLVSLCHSMLKPGGMAVIMVMGDQIASSETRSFVVGQNYRIFLRPQLHLDLPLRGRQNRDVLSLMAPFVPDKSFICRPGFMEFLFRRE
jgi:hypothetical protein